MPQYVEVKGQTIEFPDGMAMGDIEAAIKKNMLSIKPEESKSKWGNPADLVAGAVRGAGSIGATLLAPLDMAKDALAGKGLSLESNRQRRADMDAGLGSLGANTDSYAFGGGKLLGEIAGTAGAGGLIAKPLATVAPRLAQAIGSAGFSTGAPVAESFAGRAADMGLRMAGGAINGGVSAGMVGDSPGMGAAVGGALPPVAKAAGLAGAAVGRGVSAMLTPEQQAMAKKIAAMTGQKVEDVVSALNQQGPTMLGIKPTVPQILQSPAISQLQRTVINASDNSPLLAREAAQNADRLAGFNRIANVSGTVNEAADNAGNMIANYGRGARENARQGVNRLFESVDPFNDTALQLPIDAMKAQKAKFMGPGSFGDGASVSTAIKTAEDISTQVLPGIKPISQASAKTQSLEQAVRAAGGIRGTGGELRDMGIKQSGTTGLINNKSGRPADLLAEEMHSRGFLPDNDPATLFEYLRNGNGRKVFANDVNENAMQRAMDSAAGDLPGAEVIPKSIPFAHVQNFRSSLNEAWKDASMKGKNQEAAALKGMISEIDNKVAAVAEGRGNPGEAFPSDIVQTWKEALKAHAEKKARFDSGPQAKMFRQGRDGQNLIQGAEIPREFFNSRVSQVEDAQAFKKLVDSNPDLMQALKGYAVTDAAQQTTKDGMLSFNKLNNWANQRSGAIGQTFSPQDQALLKEIVQGVQAADVAATGGMAKGSNTAQNIEAAKRAISSGLLDNSATEFLANKLPFGSAALKAMQKASASSKADKLGGLLADPEALVAELKKILAKEKPGKLGGLLSDPALVQLGYRGAPLLAADR